MTAARSWLCCHSLSSRFEELGAQVQSLVACCHSLWIVSFSGVGCTSTVFCCVLSQSVHGPVFRSWVHKYSPWLLVVTVCEWSRFQELGGQVQSLVGVIVSPSALILLSYAVYTAQVLHSGGQSFWLLTLGETFNSLLIVTCVNVVNLIDGEHWGPSVAFYLLYLCNPVIIMSNVYVVFSSRSLQVNGWVLSCGGC